MRILIAEDDQVLANGLLRSLRAAGYAVDHVASGSEADAALAAHEFDLLILDLGLPKLHGLEVLKRLRSRGASVPVLILTAADSIEQRVKGLDLGADDYMAKPFNPRELVARIRSILRRMEPAPLESERYEVAGMVIDMAARSAARDGAVLDLTSAEFDLLACFVTRPQRVLSRDQLMDWTRGRKADPLDRAIDVQMSRLRRKIEDESGEIIKTVRNAGYVLSPPVKKL